MRILSAVISLSLCLIPGAMAAPGLTQHKGTAADGSRFYEDSVEIAAPVDRLWAAFTDTASYRKWAVPVAAVDFRLGGVIEASYDPNGHLGDAQNIKNEFIAYVPNRLLVFRNVQAPSMLPGGEVYGRTVKTVEFVPLDDGKTRVTVSGIGFAAGEGYDKLYAFFSNGDGAMLQTLKQAMEKP